MAATTIMSGETASILHQGGAVVAQVTGLGPEEAVVATLLGTVIAVVGLACSAGAAFEAWRGRAQ